jgi:hypothetical protein
MTNVKEAAVWTFVDLKAIVSFFRYGGFSGSECGECVFAITLNGRVKLVSCFH